MYTSKINRTEETPRGLEIFVDMYKDGVLSHTEKVVPQDRAGFDFWLKDRLKTLNEGQALKDALLPGADVEPLEPVVETPVLTQAEIDRNTWLTKYRQWVRIKQTIVDTGIVPSTNPQLVAKVDDLKATLLPEYLDFI